MSPSWLAVFGVATVVGMMLPIALRMTYLFDRQLQIKGGSGGSDETCSVGNECQSQCDLDAPYETDTCRVACKNQANAGDCGCTVALLQLMRAGMKAARRSTAKNYFCDTEACKEACYGDQNACGFTKPQPKCCKPNLCGRVPRR
jgi:hypothetical protein